MTSIRCILVNYRSPWEMLSGCLDSLAEDHAGMPCRITIVDNDSGDGVLDRVRESYPGVDIIETGGNPGFAAAVNRGVAAAGEEAILLLNTDTVLRPGALAAMAGALAAAGGSCAGVAPKMMSSSHAGIIDAVGTVMPRHGAPFNRGIGQCDLGQFDTIEEVAGVCFGAALLWRRLFEEDRVGQLYEDYFLYFEDSDWCMRATSQGYRFVTAPEAVVDHLHSGVIRHEPLPLKYRLVELNTLKIVVRTFAGRRRTAAIVASRVSRLLARTFIRRRFIAANLSTIAAFAAALPRLLRERRALRARRVTSDDHIFRLAAGEDAYFDTVAYRPHRCLESLTATYERLLARRSDPEAGKVLAALYRMRRDAGAGELAPGRYRELLAGAPECVQTLLECAARESDGNAR